MIAITLSTANHFS